MMKFEWVGRYPIRHTERRDERRVPAGERAHMPRSLPLRPLFDADVLNLSPSGVAMRSIEPIPLGERLRFFPRPGAMPVLTEVLGCDVMDDGAYRVRCHCVSGQFDV